MATHSGILAWRIPGTGSLVGCHLWGRTESDTAAAAQQQQQQQEVIHRQKSGLGRTGPEPAGSRLLARCLLAFEKYFVAGWNSLLISH